MTSPENMREQPSAFTSVLKIMGGYMAIHFQDKGRSFISEYPEKDFKIAQASAKAFAQIKTIPYKDGLFESEQPIVTVVQFGKEWFPAEMYPERIRVLKSFMTVPLGGEDHVWATKMALIIAKSQETDYMPFLGMVYKG